MNVFYTLKNKILTVLEKGGAYMYLYEQIAAQKEQEKIYREIKANPPAVPHSDDKKYVALMGSMSHTYGNALAYIQDWVLKIFPENMFKTIHVNSKIAHRQIRSTPNEYIKKTKPMIIFRPRIPGRSEDKFMKGTPLIERQTDLYNTWGATNLQPFFHDQKHEMSILYQMNREVMYVDVVILVSTLMQQLDYYHYIENAVRIEKPFTLSTCFESYIPQEMLSIVADIANIPLYDDHGSTKEFLEYMNQNSIYPITYKLQGSTKTREFYRYYPVNVETFILDLDKDDGERVGHVMDQYQISFTIKMEFNTTGFYYIVSNDLFKINLPTIHTDSSEIIPVFTDVRLREDLMLQPGWHLYNQASYRLEDSNDEVNLDQMFNESIRAALRYHKENGLPIQDVVDIKIRKQGELIHQFQDYNIDWDQYKLKFINQNTYYTYHIMVCINVEYINGLMKALYGLK